MPWTIQGHKAIAERDSSLSLFAGGSGKKTGGQNIVLYMKYLLHLQKN